jgi:hypothetical protein
MLTFLTKLKKSPDNYEPALAGIRRQFFVQFLSV